MRRLVHLSLLLLSVGGCAGASSAGRSPAVGSPAPRFEARDQNGAPVRLADLRGRPVVLYFYPKDGTPGCTREACAFRDAWQRIQASAR